MSKKTMTVERAIEIARDAAFHSGGEVQVWQHTIHKGKVVIWTGPELTTVEEDSVSPFVYAFRHNGDYMGRATYLKSFDRMKRLPL